MKWIISLLVFIFYHHLSVFSQNDSIASQDSEMVLKEQIEAVLYNKPDSAIILCKELERLALANNDTSELMLAYNLMGTANCIIGDYVKGADYFNQLNDLAILTNDSVRTAVSWHNLAGIYQIQGKYQRAVEHISKAKKYYIILKDTAKLASTLLGESVLHHNKLVSDFDNKRVRNDSLLERVKSTNQESIDFFRTIKDSAGLAHALIVKATILSYSDQPEASQSVLNEYDEFSNFAYGRNLIDVLFVKAQNADKLGQISTAEDFSLQALELAKDKNLKSEKLRVLRKLYEMYARQGQKANFEKFHSLYMQVRDSIESQELLLKIEEVETKHRTKIIEAQNELLAVQNEILRQRQSRNIYAGLLSVFCTLFMGFLLLRNQRQKRFIENQNQTLSQMVQNKNRLMAIVTHDIRSPLLGMAEIGKKIRYLLDKNDQQKLINYADHLDRSSASLLQLVENVLSWARGAIATISITKSKVKVTDVVLNVENLYANRLQLEQINITKQITPNLSINTDRNAFELIIRNLIDNAIKYSRNNSNIEILAKDENRNIILEIKNEGVPFSDEIQTEFNDPAKSMSEQISQSTLGLYLVKDMIKRLNGQISLSRNLSKNIITLVFPASS